MHLTSFHTHSDIKIEREKQPFSTSSNHQLWPSIEMNRFVMHPNLLLNLMKIIWSGFDRFVLLLLLLLLLCCAQQRTDCHTFIKCVWTSFSFCLFHVLFFFFSVSCQVGSKAKRSVERKKSLLILSELFNGVLDAYWYVFEWPVKKLIGKKKTCNHFS